MFHCYCTAENFFVIFHIHYCDTSLLTAISDIFRHKNRNECSLFHRFTCWCKYFRCAWYIELLYMFVILLICVIASSFVPLSIRRFACFSLCFVSNHICCNIVLLIAWFFLKIILSAMTNLWRECTRNVLPFWTF